MTIEQLIERLEEYRDLHGGDTEVRLMTQQNWPFEYTITGMVSGEEMDDSDEDDGDDVESDGVVYIVEGGQLGYGTCKRITMWDGVIELRDDLGINGVITLTDDDIPTPGKWREVAWYIQQRGDIVFLRDVSEQFEIRQPYASRLLGHVSLLAFCLSLGRHSKWVMR